MMGSTFEDTSVTSLVRTSSMPLCEDGSIQYADFIAYLEKPLDPCIGQEETSGSMQEHRQFLARAASAIDKLLAQSEAAGQTAPQRAISLAMGQTASQSLQRARSAPQRPLLTLPASSSQPCSW